MDDVLSLPNRLWRSLTLVGRDLPVPGPPPNSDAESIDENPSQKRRRILEQWRKYRNEHATLVEHLASQESLLGRIEADLREADENLSAAESDLRLSHETLAELQKPCGLSRISEFTNTLNRLDNQLTNLNRIIEKRRKHLDEAYFKHNNLTSIIGHHTATLYRQDSFKSDSESLNGNAHGPTLSYTRSELADLQRQVSLIEIEIKQLRNGLEALQIQSDSIRMEREKIEIEKHHAESERDAALSAQNLAVAKMQQRQLVVQQAQKRLDELMIAQLNAIIAVDKSREAIAVAENMMQELRNQEQRLMDSETHRIKVPPSLRRHSAPSLEDRAAERISEAVTLLSDDRGNSGRPGIATVTPVILLFETIGGSERKQRHIIRISDIDDVLVSEQHSLLTVHFSKHDMSLSDPFSNRVLKLYGDAHAISALQKALQRAIRCKVAQENLTVPLPQEPCKEPPRADYDQDSHNHSDLMICGESRILSKSMLEKLILSTPSRYHFDCWTKLYALVEDGMSLNTMYRSVAGSRVSLLIVMDQSGTVFGAFLSDCLKIHQGYFGSGETFVFKLFEEDVGQNGTVESRKMRKESGSFSIFPWSGKNKFFILSRSDGVSVGGGTHFAIFLQRSLRKGSSGFSDTFDSPMLSGTRDFHVSMMEVWGINSGSPVAALINNNSRSLHF